MPENEGKRNIFNLWNPFL